MWQNRAACLPPEAHLSSVISDGYIEGAWLPACRGSHYIRRGHSVINWGHTVCDYYVAPEDEADFQGLKELFLPSGATPPPPPFQYSCRYIVIDAELLCLAMGNPAVRACRAVDYEGRSGCAPEGAQFSNESADYFDAALGEMVYRSYAVITRRNSRIRYDHEEPQVDIAPEDAVDFAALEAVFRPN